MTGAERAALNGYYQTLIGDNARIALLAPPGLAGLAQRLLQTSNLALNALAGGQIQYDTFKDPSACHGTQPVELLGRIGNLTSYQVCPGATPTDASTRTMFCVRSGVTEGSLVSTEDFAVGALCTAARRRTGAQWATLAFVSTWRVDVEDEAVCAARSPSTTAAARPLTGESQAAARGGRSGRNSGNPRSPSRLDVRLSHFDGSRGCRKRSDPILSTPPSGHPIGEVASDIGGMTDVRDGRTRCKDTDRPVAGR